MKLRRSVEEKVDRSLRDELANADPASHITMVVVPAEVQRANRSAQTSGGSLQRYANRVDLRRALSEAQRIKTSDQLSAVRRALSAFDLSITGGEVVPVLVVKGAASEIVKSLELPEIASAGADIKTRL